MTDFSRIVAREIALFLGPLLRVRSAIAPWDELRRVLRAAGWRLTEGLDPTPIVEGIGEVADAVEALVAGGPPEDLGEFRERFQEIRALVENIQDLVGSIATAKAAADGVSPPDPDHVRAFGEDVLNMLATRWLSRKPVIGDLAVALGFVEVDRVDALDLGGVLARRARDVARVKPDVLVALLEDPVGHVSDRVVPGGWAGSADAATTNLLLSRWLEPLLTRVGGTWRTHPNSLADPGGFGRSGVVEFSMPAPDGAGRFDFGAEFELFSAADASESNVFGPAVEIAPFGGYAGAFEVGPASLDVGMSVSLGGVDDGDAHPALRFTSSGVETSGDVDVDAHVAAGVDLDIVFGGEGTRLTFGRLNIDAFADARDGDWDVGIGVLAAGSRVVLSARDLGAVASALASGFETTVEFDLGLMWSRARGLTLAGAAALEMEVAEGIKIGGVVKLDGLRVRLEIGEDLRLATTTNLGINLGPVAMNLGGVGMGLALSFPEDGGNLGKAHLDLVARPPDAVGVVVDAAVVSGGGYLYVDPEGGEYAGFLELGFPAMSLSLKAIGILTTELPDGRDGYALTLLVYTDFPAIQLGYGFTLNGVGGILGIQHGVSVDALQNGLRAGVLDNVLFPSDPVANAPAVLDDLRAVFPVAPGSLTFGPALRIGWGGGIMEASLALVLQLDNVIGPGAGDPELARVVLLGQLRIVLPPADNAPEVVRFLVDILGYYDFDGQEMGIDAALRDSHFSGIPITGTLLVRARFGDDATFIMAVGGFHPRFTDLPPGLPTQVRLGARLTYDKLVVSFSCYTAITSNSFQFGAEVVLVAGGSNFEVEAYFGFDTLIFLVPRVHFLFEFRLGASVSYKRWDLASIQVKGAVSGPGRWEVGGRASISVAGLSVGIEFEEAWGSAPAISMPSRPVLPEIEAALNASDAWSSSVSDGRALASLRIDPAADAVFVHPIGLLHARQKVMPFGVAVDKVRDFRPADLDRVDIQEARIGDRSVAVTPSKEHFARGDYFDLSPEEKLNTPSFERFDAGVAFGVEEFSPSSSIGFEPDCETIHIGEPDVVENTVSRDDVWALAKFGAVAASAPNLLHRLEGARGAGVTVRDAPYAAVAVDELELVAEGHVDATYTEARWRADNSAGTLIVVERAETR